jgi:hypothetical protein
MWWEKCLANRIPIQSHHHWYQIISIRLLLWNEQALSGKLMLIIQYKTYCVTLDNNIWCKDSLANFMWFFTQNNNNNNNNNFYIILNAILVNTRISKNPGRVFTRFSDKFSTIFKHWNKVNQDTGITSFQKLMFRNFRIFQNV